MGRILLGWLAATIISLVALFTAAALTTGSPASSGVIVLGSFFVSNAACYAISMRYIVIGYSPGILRTIFGFLATYGFALMIALGASLLWMGLFKPWTGAPSMRESSWLDGLVFVGSYVFSSLVGYGLSARYIINR